MDTPPPVPPSLPPSIPPAPAAGSRPATTTGTGLSGGMVVLIVGACCLVGLFVLAILAGMLLPALAKAKQKAQSIKCVNNLKQLGLAARIYSVDHAGHYPGTWLQASNEITSPLLLVCPGDKTRVPAATWTEIDAGNISYEFDGKGATETQANRVIGFCPIHGHIVLADGSVIPARSPRQPVPVTQRQGASWYMGPVR